MCCERGWLLLEVQGRNILNFAEAVTKSKSEKISPLVQALDASNPTSLPSYLPSHLATAINYTYPTPLQGGVATSRGHTHLGGGGQGVKGVYSSDSPQSGMSPNLSNQFLGQSQPGFPSSCFRVKGHKESGNGSGSGTSTVSSASSATASSDSSNSLATTSSYSSCLGPDWPDLGITLGQASSKLPVTPDLGTAVGSKGVAPPSPDGVGGAEGAKGVPAAASRVESDTSSDSSWKTTSGAGNMPTSEAPSELRRG